MICKTIMTADMAGFSTRMREDEESIIQLLMDTYYALAEESVSGAGGRLFRREGDAIWCEFETPAEALRASLQLLEGVHLHNLGHPHQEICLRIGVHHGPVTVSQGELFGQTLSQAKQLESSAPVGSVHLSPEACRQLPEGHPSVVCLSPERLEQLAARQRERQGAPKLVIAIHLQDRDALQNALGLARQYGGQLYEWEESRALLVFPPDVDIRIAGAICKGEVLHHRLEGSGYAELTGKGVEEALQILELLQPGQLVWSQAALPAGAVAESWGSDLYLQVESPRLVRSVRVMAAGRTALVVGITTSGETAASRETEIALQAHPELQAAYEIALWAWENGLPIPDTLLLSTEPEEGFVTLNPHEGAAVRQWLQDQTAQDHLTQLAQDDQLVIVLASPLEGGDFSEICRRLGHTDLEETDGVQDALEGWARQLGDSPLAETLEKLDCPLLAFFADPRLPARTRQLAGPLVGEALLLSLPQLEETSRSLLSNGTLLWVCAEDALGLLKDLHTALGRLYPNRKPAFLSCPGLPAGEEKRWARRNLAPLHQPLAALLPLRQRRQRVARRQSRALAAPERPYKFLNYYSREDRAIFCGRDAEAENLLSRVLRDQVLVVYGKSGVGKTSLLRAGLLPNFAPPQDLVLILRVLAEPGELLRLKLSQILGRSLEGRMADWLGQAAASVSGQVVVILDQFEEFFVRCSSKERRVFVAHMADLIERDPLRCHVVLSLREDFLAEMSEFENACPTILSNRMRIQALSKAQARQAIIQPARLFHLVIQEELVEELLDQLWEEGIDPPELQIVLDRLCQQGALNLESYRQLGGVRQILVGYLQETLNSQLGPESQKARSVLKAMVTERGTKAVVTLNELASRLRESPENLAAVLQLLLDSRLLRTLGEDHEARYELAHEYLVQEVVSWQSEGEVASKHANLVLRSELRNFKRLGSMLPADRLRLIGQQESHLSLSLEERAFLLRASVVHGQDPTLWIHGQQGLDVLLHLLDDPGLTGPMQRSIVRALAPMPLDDLAAQHLAEAARRVGNPTLLAEVRAPGRLFQALEQAVWERFRGPQAMTLVPAGPAWLGSSATNKADRKSRMRPDLHARVDSEADYRQVSLDSFWIDRCLVSNAQYAEFRPPHIHLYPSHEADHPAVNVSYWEAAQYAAWLGKELPTEPEWEKAARGPDGQLFPWGNEFAPERLNSAESGLRQLTPVHAYPEGASPYGCLNMSGTVWEWTSTPWLPDSPLMAKKGGCSVNFEPLMQSSARFEDPPEMRLRWVGFRLVDRSRRVSGEA